MTAIHDMQWGVLGVGAVVLLSGCGAHTDVTRQAASGSSAPVRPSEAAGRAYHDPGNRLSATIPPGWIVVHQPLTQLTEPRQVFAATAFRLHQTKPDHNCTPRTAIREMGDGAFVFVIESGKPGQKPSAAARRWFKPRPRRFRLDPARYGARECFGEEYQWIFRDSGRRFYAFVYLNPKRTPRATRLAAVSLLNSLRFRPAGAY